MLRNNITYSTEIFVRKQITQTLEQIQRYSRKRNELSPKIPIRISILARKNYSNRGQWNRARVVAKTKGMHLERHVTMPSRTCVGVCVSGGGGGARVRALCHWIGVNDLNNVYTNRTRRPSNFENSHNFDCDFAPSDCRTPSFFRFVILRNDRFNRERERERENCWKNLYLFLCILLRVVSNIEILHVSKFWIYW